MSEQGQFHYVGDELGIFALATNWKARLAREIRPYFGRHVLEVGAGRGETARVLISPNQARWTLLEPDPELAGAALDLQRAGHLRPACDVRVGSTADLGAGDLFDSAIYVDVLEHIEHDAEELDLVARHVKPAGHIVVVSPAHQWLYSEFDRRIGHFRRYTRRSLRAISPAGTRLVRLRYLDAVGMAASGANRLLLKQSLPTAAQVLFWDRRMVPMSRFVDPLLGYLVGKSILAVWRRE